MATCGIFFFAGWTAPNYAVLALMIGGVVCIAAAIAGRHFAGFEDGISGGIDAVEAAAWVVDWRDGVDDCDWRDAESDEYRLERYVPTQIAVNLAALPTGREGGAEFVSPIRGRTTC